jgi:hypothetical protein
VIERLNTEECEMCGEKDLVEMHHVRKMKDVNKKGQKAKPAWAHRMARINRKTLALCHTCHISIHESIHRPEWDIHNNTLESRVN